MELLNELRTCDGLSDIYLTRKASYVPVRVLKISLFAASMFLVAAQELKVLRGTISEGELTLESRLDNLKYQINMNWL